MIKYNKAKIIIIYVSKIQAISFQDAPLNQWNLNCALLETVSHSFYLRFAIFRSQISHECLMRQVLICCIFLSWHTFYLILLAMTICGDARRNVSLPSRGRDSRVLHSGFSRVRIYHNFCRDAELIHYLFQARISFISRLEYTSG